MMWSGNTGRSGAPHLHLELRSTDVRRCPQLLLRELYETGGGVEVTALADRQCEF